MNSALSLISLVIIGAVAFLLPGVGPGALIVCAALCVPVFIILVRTGLERTFLLRLFTIGILVRVLLATVIYLAHYEEFFGGDAITYDFFGSALQASWHGDAYQGELYSRFVRNGAGAWGMLYVVATVYELIGRNMFAIQLFNAVVGSATAVLIYKVAQTLFENSRVSRMAAIMVCLYPSLILWSSQALKDALIIFCLALGILMTLRLMSRVKVLDGVILGFSLIGLLSLRFYIFYMMVAAVIGAFVIGSKAISAQSLVGRFVLISLMGVGVYLGWCDATCRNPDREIWKPGDSGTEP